MKKALSIASIILSLIAIFSIHTLQSAETNSLEAQKAEAVRCLGTLPTFFIENQGQTAEEVKYYFKGNDTTYFTDKGVVFQKTGARGQGGEERGSMESSPPQADVAGESIDRVNGLQRQSLAYRLDFVGAHPTAPQARNALQAKVNYLIGNDPSGWHTDLPTYREIIYPGLYTCHSERSEESGITGRIDLVYRSAAEGMKYEFVVSPGASPDDIKLAYTGIEGLSIDESGNLIIHTPLGDVKDKKPYAYQEIEGRQVEVSCNFRIQDSGVRIQNTEYSIQNSEFGILNSQPQVYCPQFAYGFEVSSYDPNYPLLIDPCLEYVTYLGGSGADWANDIAVDASGNAYVTGETRFPGFPTTPGAFDTSHNISADVFVTKLDPTGSGLLYSTFIGGSVDERGFGIAVDASGNAYVTGQTSSANFPTTPGAFDTSYNGGGSNGDAFVIKLNSTGSSLLYSTFLGGTAEEWSNDIAVDASGNAYAAGFTGSTNFPTTPGAFDTSFNGGDYNIFVTKLNPTGSGLLYSTFIGAGRGHGVAVDASGNAYVTGQTYSTTFPTTPGAFDTSHNGPSGSYDAFVTKLNSTGSSLLYSTFLGGSREDAGFGIAVDGSGNAYVTGSTDYTDFPTTPGAFDTSPWFSAFVTKLNPTGSSLIYSTALGDIAYGQDIAIDASGNAYVTGYVSSPGFPTTPGAFDTSFNYFGGDRYEAFATKLDSTGSNLLYSTYLGGNDRDVGWGIAVDASGSMFVTGLTSSADFPTTNFAFQHVPVGLNDAFVARLTPVPPSTPLVEKLLPDKGGDTGLVSVLIHGCKFAQGATVKLARIGQPDIVGTPTGVAGDGDTIATTFDLTGKARGVWDIVVTNPDSTFAILSGGFTIEEGVPPQVWVDISGRPAIRPGREQVFIVTFGNRGNVNAMGVPLWIGGIPKDATWKLGFEITPPPLLPGDEPIDWSGLPIHIETAKEIILPLLVPLIPPGLTETRKITIEVPSTTPVGEEFQLWTGVNPPWFATVPPKDLEAAACLSEIATAAAQTLVGALGGNCVTAVQSFVVDMNLEMANRVVEGWTGRASSTGTTMSMLHMVASAAKVALRCVGAVYPPLKAVLIAADAIMAGYGIYDKCKDIAIKMFERFLRVRVVASFDPNEKVGSQGAEVVHFVSGQEPLRYAVFFENVETATAPAQEVIITDLLDVANVDLSTFSLGPIAFGDKQVSPTPGLRNFTTSVDLRPHKNLLVKVTANLDITTGLISWHFVSIDPATGKLPEDPMAGFLPPNVNPPEGDGNVLFTVMPKKGLPTGTEIRNRASIVFDLNPPIDTGEWLNTIDNDPPASQLLPLGPYQGSPTFAVEWGGTDIGSGIMDYTIFVSKEDGPYTAWLRNTAATSGMFTGEPGKKYAFYSVARDQTGNTEAAPQYADATTFISTCDPTYYAKGLSYVKFREMSGTKDKASLKMGVSQAFCEALKRGPQEIAIILDECNKVSIPGNRLNSNGKKTKFWAHSAAGETPRYHLTVNCQEGWMRLHLKDVDLNGCVTNPVKACVSIKDGPCLCAEALFEEKRNKKGNLSLLFLRVTDIHPK